MQPGQFQPRGEDWFVRKLQELEGQVQRLAAANPFAAMGVKPMPDGLIVEGYETVNGPLEVNGTSQFDGSTTINGPLEVNGNSTFTGDTDISGTMTASNANIDGNITQNNGYGSLSFGPELFPGGAPGLRFFRNGTTFAYNPGVSLFDEPTHGTCFIVQGPAPAASDQTNVWLYSSGKWGIGAASASPSPYISTTAGANGTIHLGGGSSNGSVNMNPTGTGNCQVNGNFAVTGSKAFLMDHPLDPESMTLMHAATESDRNGVEYWDTAITDESGSAVVELPRYFEALTKPARRNIQLTPNTGCSPWVSDIVDGQFTIHAPAGTKVHWLVKAERHQVVDGHDVLAFPAEMDKPLVGPQLPEPGVSGAAVDGGGFGGVESV